MKRTAKQSNFKQLKTLVKREWSNLGFIFLALLLAAIVIPGTVQADDVPHPTSAERMATRLMVKEMTNSYEPFGSFPASAEREAPRTLTVTTTAYSSDVWQTDSTPFITASGTTVRHGVLAANFLPIGTKVKIPDLYGEQVFVVEDRMNARYWQRMDIWMSSYEEAKEFGVQKLEIEIYE